MAESGIENSPMEKWLREKNMSSKEFCHQVGCSRPIVWKVKRLLPISPKYAKKIEELTEGKVCPKAERVGGRR